MKNYKIWGIGLVAYVLLLLIVVGALTGVIDPFFHYRAPLEQLEYPIDNQRYQNDGIMKHFDYDAMIIGSSMTENFRTSEMDRLFDVNAIKVPFSGPPFPELNQNLRTALKANPDIKMVIYGLETWYIFAAKDETRTDASYPTYLYDEKLLNDVNYLLNKDVLFSDTLEVLLYTGRGEKTTSFDDYSNWRHFVFSHEETLRNYPRPEITETQRQVTAEEMELIRYNMEQIVTLAREYPDVQFHYYFPPYSALYWDEVRRNGKLDYMIDSLKLASEVALQAENVLLHSLLDGYEVVLDLNHYRDTVHHSGEINTWVLEKLREGDHRLTLENNEAHWESLREFYSNYDFEVYFTQE